MGSGRDKRKKVKDKAKAKNAAEERREKLKMRADGLGAESLLVAEEPVVDKTQAKKDKKLAKASGAKELTELINEIRKRDKERQEVVVERCDPPSPRLNFSLNLVSSSEALLFGGEHYDGAPANTFVYNELYRWHIDKNEWFKIDTLNTPPPRCSHQAIVYRDALYVFGGEFCTSDKFHHHRDLWRLNLGTMAWEELKAKGGPSARSGHRMAVWRNSIVLFGGFYEAFRETQWWNDLYLFSVPALTWRRVEFAATAPLPGPRSGHQLLVHGDKLVINGGYTKLKRLKKTETKVHRDMWSLDLTPLLSADGMSCWERVPRKGQAPTERAGACLVAYQRRGVQFGGVYDGAGGLTEKTAAYDGKVTDKKTTAREKAVFFNDLFAFDLEHQRWYELPLASKKEGPLKKRRKAKSASEASEAASSTGGDDEEGEDEEEEEAEEGEDNEDDDEEEDVAGEAKTHAALAVGFVHQGSPATVTAVCEDLGWMNEGHDWWGGDASFDAPVHQAGSGRGGATALGASGACASSAASLGDPWVLGPWSFGEKSSPAMQPATQPAMQPATRALAPAVAGAAVPKEIITGVGGPVAVALASAAAAAAPPQAPLAHLQHHLSPMPLGRLNPSLLVKNHTLIMYGGTYESGNREWALDDGWSLDLRERDCWKRLIVGTPHDFTKKNDSDSEDEDAPEGDESGRLGEGEEKDAKDRESDSSSDEEAHEVDIPGRSAGHLMGDRLVRHARAKLSVQEEMEQFRASFQVDDANITPRGLEPLRDFFARTSGHWTRQASQASVAAAEGGTRCEMDVKDVRRAAFALASERFEVLRPHMARLDELEKLQNQGEASGPSGGYGAGGGGGAAVGGQKKAPAKKVAAKPAVPGRAPVGTVQGRAPIGTPTNMHRQPVGYVPGRNPAGTASAPK